MASKGRDSTTGYRFDNPDIESYARAAGPGLELWSEFLVNVLMQRHLDWPADSPIRRVAQECFAFNFLLHKQNALFEIALIQPDLQGDLLDSAAGLRACDKLLKTKAYWLNLEAQGKLKFADRSKPFIARRSTMYMLVGAVWLNLPPDLPADKSVNAIADVLLEGKDRKKLRLHLRDKVRRAREIFLRIVACDNGPGTLITASGLPIGLALMAHAEQAMRALWTSAEAKPWLDKFDDCAEAVNAMVRSQAFFEPMWTHFMNAHSDHNTDAVAAIRNAVMQRAPDVPRLASRNIVEIDGWIRDR